MQVAFKESGLQVLHWGSQEHTSVTVIQQTKYQVLSY